MSTNNNALIAIAAAATALAAAATALVSGEKTTCGNTNPAPTPDAEPVQEEAPAPTKRRGRPPGNAAPAETAAEPEPEKKPVGKTLDELREAIRPLVVQGGEQQAEVKKVIAKYAPKLSEIDPKDHAAFLKDIEALNM